VPTSASVYGIYESASAYGFGSTTSVVGSLKIAHVVVSYVYSAIDSVDPVGSAVYPVADSVESVYSVDEVAVVTNRKSASFRLI
jgi:hypothetical protein